MFSLFGDIICILRNCAIFLFTSEAVSRMSEDSCADQGIKVFAAVIGYFIFLDLLYFFLVGY